jgi:hypothetical protein
MSMQPKDRYKSHLRAVLSTFSVFTDDGDNGLILMMNADSDRSFVQNKPDDKGSMTLAKAVIALAHELELDVTAGGRNRNSINLSQRSSMRQYARLPVLSPRSSRGSGRKTRYGCCANTFVWEKRLKDGLNGCMISYP